VTQVPDGILRHAHQQRELRWAREKAEQAFQVARESLKRSIAEWRGTYPDRIKFSSVACFKAPADLGCTYVLAYNPFTNPCVFCGAMEQDVL
jgi:triacylglycerol esterase/lipase EstA (alpha/beta hydrolase family)